MAERRDDQRPAEEARGGPSRERPMRRERRREHAWEIQDAASFRFPRI